MIKFGKWIGAGLGLALGGPLGGLLGLLIGNAIDNIQTEPLNSNGTPGTPPVSGRGDFLFSLTVLATAIMKADGRMFRTGLCQRISEAQLRLRGHPGSHEHHQKTEYARDSPCRCM